jgi:hypothetical protein
MNPRHPLIGRVFSFCQFILVTPRRNASLAFPQPSRNGEAFVLDLHFNTGGNPPLTTGDGNMAQHMSNAGLNIEIV